MPRMRNKVKLVNARRIALKKSAGNKGVLAGAKLGGDSNSRLTVRKRGGR